MCKQALLDGKKLAEKALKRVQAKKKAEDCKKTTSLCESSFLGDAHATEDRSDEGRHS